MNNMNINESYSQGFSALAALVTVVFIHTMEDDQRLNTLVHKSDSLLQNTKIQLPYSISSSATVQPWAI